LLAPLLIALPLLWRNAPPAGARHRSSAHAIGVISHEMRNSAQAVLTSIELLGQSTLPKGERDLLRLPAAPANPAQPVEPRTGFSRLASGASSRMRNPAMQPSSAGRRWRRSGHRPSGGLQLHLDAQGASPSNILVDADALRQIASNLLANAVKFTDSAASSCACN
jgi:two-component system sensor histidine kinase EvgS